MTSVLQLANNIHLINKFNFKLNSEFHKLSPLFSVMPEFSSVLKPYSLSLRSIEIFFSCISFPINYVGPFLLFLCSRNISVIYLLESEIEAHTFVFIYYKFMISLWII
jgi:hypothetical protein